LVLIDHPIDEDRTLSTVFLVQSLPIARPIFGKLSAFRLACFKLVVLQPRDVIVLATGGAGVHRQSPSTVASAGCGHLVFAAKPEVRIFANRKRHDRPWNTSYKSVYDGAKHRTVVL